MTTATASGTTRSMTGRPCARAAGRRTMTGGCAATARLDWFACVRVVWLAEVDAMTVRIRGYGRRRRIVFSRARRIRRYWGRGPVIVITAFAVPVVAFSMVQAVRSAEASAPHRPAVVHVHERPAVTCGTVRVRHGHQIVRRPVCVPLRGAHRHSGRGLLRAIIAWRVFRSLRHLVPYRLRHPYRFGGRRYRPFTVRFSNQFGE